LSFEAEPRAVKQVLLDALRQQPEDERQCKEYANHREFRSLDHLLDWLVFESPFTVLVIIDEIPETLEAVLARKFQFGVKVLSLSRYRRDRSDAFYQFEPFLADLIDEVAPANHTEPSGPSAASSVEVDTVVVPARDDGFEDVFITENRWYKVRIHGSMRPQIKYIAVYGAAPVSAITHIAPVKSIEPWENSEKFVLNFAEPAEKVQPIPPAKGGRVKNVQSLRYTTRARLESARSLDDLW
jgi:hypothetical protein